MSSTPSNPPYIVDGKTDAERYFEGCIDGTYVVCRHVKKLANIMLPRIRDGYKNWHYSVDAALRPVRFIEKFCRIPSANKIGQPFILAPYERVVIETAFGFVDDDGARQFREVLVEWARKCGKTSLLAALNLYMLTSDPDSKGVECYNGATSSAQASLCYGATVSMTEMSPLLNKRIRRGKVHKRDVTGLNYDEKHNYLCTISSGAAKHLDGLSTFFAVLDELGVCEDGGATYDLVTESMSAHRSPMVFIISTENYVRNNIWDERKSYAYGWLDGSIEDDRFLPFLYEMDSREEIYDEAMWPKASPGLGITKDWQFIRDRLNKAKQSPARMPSVLTKDFNLPSNSYYSFLSREECISSQDTFEFNPMTDRYGCLAFDLASKNDLCSCTAVFMRPGDERIYEISMSWIASEQIKINSALDFKERDAVPYSTWAANGWLRIVDSDKVDQRVIIDWIQELAEMGLYIRWAGYDKWHVDDWTKRELSMLVGEKNFEAIPQMPKDLSPAMKEHQLDLRAKRIVYNNNPILVWARSNVQSKPPDANNNYFPQKRDLKPSKKIDPYMSELMAYIELKKHWAEYMQLIGWYTHEG